MQLSIKQINIDDELDCSSLIESSSTTTFFQTKDWLMLWMKYWGKNGKTVIYAVFDNDELVGIAPFHITDRINILGAPGPTVGSSLSDFGDIIIKSGREKEVWEAVLKNIKRDSSTSLGMTKGKNIRMEFNFIREESPSFKVLQNLGGKVEEMEVSPYIDLPKTWDEYLSTLDRHDRHEIRRKMRKAEESGVVQVCHEINEENIKDFFKLMIASNENKGSFLSENMKIFFDEVIMRFGPNKLLTLCFLRYNNISIAGILLFYQKNDVLLYNSGFDPKYSFLSPGLILNVYSIKQAIEERKNRFDFLRGNEKYKYDLGGKERKLYKFKFD